MQFKFFHLGEKMNQKQAVLLDPYTVQWSYHDAENYQRPNSRATVMRADTASITTPAKPERNFAVTTVAKK